MRGVHVAGDSVSWGSGVLPFDSGYRGQLELLFGAPCAWVGREADQRGRLHTTQAGARLDEIRVNVEAARAAGMRSSVVVVQGGHNDITQGQSAQIPARWRDLLVSAAGLADLVIALPITHRTDPAGAALPAVNADLRAIATDVGARWVDVRVGYDPAWLSDYLHPSSRGYRHFADVLFPHLVEHL